MEFLTSSELLDICKKNNKTVVFYPHRNMQKFIDDFKHIENEYIKIASWPEYDVQDLLKKSSLLKYFLDIKKSFEISY